jgi:Holliday junction resolvase RusA-like endonuclease
MSERFTVSFWVPGIPRPQGSKRGFATPKGKVVMVEMSKALPGWRADVRAAATLMRPFPNPLPEGPISLTAHFVFTRPKSHFFTGKRSDVLRPDAPSWVTKAPDISKLFRGIEDAMESILFKNDSQIVWESGSKKFGGSPGVRITLESLPSPSSETGAAAEAGS